MSIPHEETTQSLQVLSDYLPGETETKAVVEETTPSSTEDDLVSTLLLYLNPNLMQDAEEGVGEGDCH